VSFDNPWGLKVKKELAELWPPLPPDEFEELKKSIAERGLLEPIVVNENNEVLSPLDCLPDAFLGIVAPNSLASTHFLSTSSSSAYLLNLVVASTFAPSTLDTHTFISPYLSMT